MNWEEGVFIFIPLQIACVEKEKAFCHVATRRWFYGVRSPFLVPCFDGRNLVCLSTTIRDGWLKEQEYIVDIVHDLAPRTLVW